MNPWAIGGVVLIVLGILIWVWDDAIQILVGLTFIGAGLVLAARGFGMIRS